MRETLNKFHASIIVNSDEHVLPLLKENSRISRSKQMAVYIEGYRIRLAGAVTSDHKAFCNYIGGKSEKIIAQFVEKVSSDSYSLDFYPFKFASYLSDQKIKPEAKELAQLESLIGQTFMARDSEPLKAQTILGMNEAEMDAFRFKPRVASALQEFNYDVEKYLQEFRAEKKPRKINKKKIYLFIVRHNNEIQRHQLVMEEFYLLKYLLSGMSIDEAAMKIESEYEGASNMINEMFAQWLQKWLMNGFFAA